MRALLTVCLVVAFIGALLGRAMAASTCTGWLQYADNQAACLAYVKSKTSNAGFHGQVSTDTIYFWFGTNVVGVRCIAEHGVIMMFGYHHDDQPAACNLMDRIKNSLD
jgi:hypothetical protein